MVPKECSTVCRGQRFRWILPIGAVQLLQITRNAFLNLLHAPLHLGACEVAVAVVHRLELRAVNGNAGLGKLG